jgi:4-hydroxy-2-oxoglutarate aldolase
LNNASQNKPAARLSKQELCGIFLPITTPFHSDGALNFQGLRSNITKWNGTGIRGYVILGSTGERVNLSDREQLEVYCECREVIPADRLFIAGVGRQSTFATIAEIQQLTATVSVDAVLVITPHFYRAAITQEALVDHYSAIGNASPVPLILYSMPALTGIKIEPATAAELGRHPNIIGIKDSSNDLDAFKQTIQLTGDDFAVLTGNGTILREALQAGACGAILAVGCVAAELCLEIFRSMNSRECERAEQLQESLTPLATAVTTRFGLGGLKAALDMIGYTGGAVRAPLRAAGADARAQIRLCLEASQAALVEPTVSR